MKGFLVAGLVLAAALFWWFKAQAGTITIGSTKVKVSLAATEAERQQGLSGRDSLKDNEGMLFVFDRPERYGFWMKEMKFDLDFIWINGDQVVEITPNVPAPKAGKLPATLKPVQPADKVLEVNSGFSAKHGIKVGDKVEY